jgi:hypothetical protein
MKLPFLPMLMVSVLLLVVFLIGKYVLTVH